MGEENNHYHFQGFASPTTTPVPDQLFDELLYHLSPTEIVVLLYIIRRTYGFKKQSDNISLNQMVNGITTKEGKVLDRGTGLSKATVARSLNSLEEKGVITRIRRRSADRGDEPTTYAIRELHPVSQIKTPRVSGTAQALSHQRDTQETALQETEKQPSNIRMGKQNQISSKSEEHQRASVVQESEPPRGNGPLAAALKRNQATKHLSGRQQKRYDDNRQRILAFTEDFAREFNDQAPLVSSISRAYNLWHRSGISIEAFSSFMYEARALTNEYSARVRKTDDKSSGWGPQKNKMAYYFAILEGLVEQYSPNGSAAPPKKGNGYSDIAGAGTRTIDQPQGSQSTRFEPPHLPRTAGSSSRRLSGPSAKKRAPKREEEALWETVRSSLTDLNPAHEQWLRGAQGYEQNGRFVLSVSDQEAKAWIEARLMPAIQRALELSGRSELVLEVTV